MSEKNREKNSEYYKKIARSIGLRLYYARITKKISQTELAKAANLSIAFISEIEHGKVIPSILTYCDLCRILELDTVIPDGSELVNFIDN